ncbi:MAG: hypothetical protein VB142_02835 [Burkholderia sp.]
MNDICKRYVELAFAEIDLSNMTSITVDETSYQRGHNYLTLVADARERKVVFVIEGKECCDDRSVRRAPARAWGRARANHVSQH